MKRLLILASAGSGPAGRARRRALRPRSTTTLLWRPPPPSSTRCTTRHPAGGRQRGREAERSYGYFVDKAQWTQLTGLFAGGRHAGDRRPRGVHRPGPHPRLHAWRLWSRRDQGKEDHQPHAVPGHRRHRSGRRACQAAHAGLRDEQRRLGPADVRERIRQGRRRVEDQLLHGPFTMYTCGTAGRSRPRPLPGPIPSASRRTCRRRWST